MKAHATQSKIAAVMLAGALSCIGMAHAAEAPAAHSQASALNDKELNAFVKVYVDYQRIRSSYAPALEKTKDPAQKRQIEQEANAKIKRSLDSQGLSPERYNQIFAQVNSNESLRKKVLKQVEEERKKS